MEGKRKADGAGVSPKKKRCGHDTRVAAYQTASLQDAFKLPASSSSGAVDAVNVERAAVPGGLLVVRNFCSRDEADAIYYTLESDDAAGRVSPDAAAAFMLWPHSYSDCSPQGSACVF